LLTESKNMYRQLQETLREAENALRSVELTVNGVYEDLVNGGLPSEEISALMAEYRKVNKVEKVKTELSAYVQMAKEDLDKYPKVDAVQDLAAEMQVIESNLTNYQDDAKTQAEGHALLSIVKAELAAVEAAIAVESSASVQLCLPLPRPVHASVSSEYEGTLAMAELVGILFCDQLINDFAFEAFEAQLQMLAESTADNRHAVVWAQTHVHCNLADRPTGNKANKAKGGRGFAPSSNEPDVFDFIVGFSQALGVLWFGQEGPCCFIGRRTRVRLQKQAKAAKSAAYKQHKAAKAAEKAAGAKKHQADNEAAKDAAKKRKAKAKRRRTTPAIRWNVRLRQAKAAARAAKLRTPKVYTSPAGAKKPALIEKTLPPVADYVRPIKDAQVVVVIPRWAQDPLWDEAMWDSQTGVSPVQSYWTLETSANGRKRVVSPDTQRWAVEGVAHKRLRPANGAAKRRLVEVNAAKRLAAQPRVIWREFKSAEENVLGLVATLRPVEFTSKEEKTAMAAAEAYERALVRTFSENEEGLASRLERLGDAIEAKNLVVNNEDVETKAAANAAYEEAVKVALTGKVCLDLFLESLDELDAASAEYFRALVGHLLFERQQLIVAKKLAKKAALKEERKMKQAVAKEKRNKRSGKARLSAKASKGKSKKKTSKNNGGEQ
jgi:hypothetical protein